MTKIVFKYIIPFIVFVYVYNILFYYLFHKNQLINDYDTLIAEYNMQIINTDKPTSLENLIEYDKKKRLKDFLERKRENILETNEMLNPIHIIPFSLGAFRWFYPMYILSLLTVYFINLKKIREI